MVKLKMEHVIMVAIVAFVLYSLISRCGCSGDGFNVGGQSETECLSNLEKLDVICCDNNNCPDGYPIKCNASCNNHIQKILSSCINSPSIDKIKNDLSLSCKGEPCKADDTSSDNFCGDEAKKCMCDSKTKDDKYKCKDLVGNKHYWNNDNCPQCKSNLNWWEKNLEYCHPKEVWCGKTNWRGACGENECPKNCDTISVSKWDGHGKRDDADMCRDGQKVQCHCPLDYTPTGVCYIPH